MRQISVKDMAYPGFGENPGLADVGRKGAGGGPPQGFGEGGKP